MQVYLDLLQKILSEGTVKHDRTGTGTKSIFGHQMRFDLAEGFPLLTTKKLHLKSIIYELLWFLSGRTDNEWLAERGVRIWNEWSTAEQCARFGRVEGDLGPIYGHQWRNFGATENPDGSFQKDGLDQIGWVLDEMKRNPDSRRLIVTGWNPLEQGKVALPPCHTLFQFYVADGKLSCQLYQRSADVFLGVPFNIASYAILTMMVAQVMNLKLGHFVHTLGDAHLYLNHLEQAKLQLTRSPKVLPKLKMNPAVKDLFAFEFEDFELCDYNPEPHIKAEVSV